MNRFCACLAHLGSVHFPSFSHVPHMPDVLVVRYNLEDAEFREDTSTLLLCGCSQRNAMPPGTTVDGEAKSTGSQKVPLAIADGSELRETCLGT